MIAETKEQAHAAVNTILVDRNLGNAGNKIIIEEFIRGTEVSFIVMTDGQHVLPLANSQDHKRLLDGDQGPNTGGMGAYSPTPFVSNELQTRILQEIIQPVIVGMKKEGIRYCGFLYAGLMITSNGEPKVLEFNCRMGDPETQPIMLRLKSDFFSIVEHAVNKTLDTALIEWDSRTALGVVMAAQDYPEKPRKNDVIHGLKELMHDQEHDHSFHIFHSGTAIKENSDCDEIVTAGGRVLCVTSLGETTKIAQENAYRLVNRISFKGYQFRKDIGYQGVNDPK